jgi:predicted Zn-dependent peptidase
MAAPIRAAARKQYRRNEIIVADRFELSPTPIKQFTLQNGLRVVMSPDSAVPVVSVALYYDVGSRNEKTGRTGFAHLFEHMRTSNIYSTPAAR